MKVKAVHLKPLTCIDCRKPFSTHSNLKRHYKLIHSRTTKDFLCSRCLAPLHSFKSLQRHTEKVHKETILRDLDMMAVCGLCENSYPALGSLWQHMRVCHLHRASKSHECSICGELLSEDLMAPHYAQMHPTVNCQRCGEAFGSYNSYNIHFSRTHFRHPNIPQNERNKPIICGICTGQYEHVKSFTRHVFTCHLKKVPRGSDICYYCLAVVPLAGMKKHMEGKHDRFECRLCREDVEGENYQLHLDSHFK